MTHFLKPMLTITLVAIWSAIPAAAQTYDMVDYMFHDNTRKANVLMLNDGQVQQIRAYCPAGVGGTCNWSGDRFYITKNWNGSGATDFEEYEFDSSWIYLVRDTSWQPPNWCSGADTSFELWTDGINRGQRFPRYVTHGSTYWTNFFEIRSRREDNCRVCDGPNDSNFQQNQRNRFRFNHQAWKYFASTQQWVSDVMQVEILDGPGAGANEVYYYAKGLGFVGYEDIHGHAHYKEPANGGNDFEVAVQDPCGGNGCGIGKTGWNHYTAIGDFYHSIGRQDGYDWSANVWDDSGGFLSYGPYDNGYGSGRHTLYHLMWIDNNTANNDIVATIDVVGRSGQMLLAQRHVRRQDFTAAQSWQWITLQFDDACFENIETRIWWHDRSYLKHGQTYIHR